MTNYTIQPDIDSFLKTDSDADARNELEVLSVSEVAGLSSTLLPTINFAGLSGTFISESEYAALSSSLVNFGTVNTIFNTATGLQKSSLRNSLNSLSFLNVKDFGAVGDNTTNDTVAFSGCFSYGLANNIKRVFVPAGRYKLENVKVPSAFILFGAGSSGGTAWEDTTIPTPLSRLHPWALSSACVLHYEDIDANLIEDIDIEYVSTTQTPFGYGIKTEYNIHPVSGYWPGAGLTLRRCNVRNFSRGLYSNGANRVHIEDCHIVQNKYNLFLEGLTSTLTCLNSEFGGNPKDGDLGLGLSLSNVQGAIFAGCEFGNNYRILDMASGAVSFISCNVETVKGPYAFGVTSGRLAMNNVSYAAISGSFVRNTGVGTDVYEGTNVVPRSGTVYFDDRILGYQTRTDNDFPRLNGSPMAWVRTESNYTTIKEIHSDRSPLPFSKLPYIQKIDVAQAPTTSTGFAAENNGSATTGVYGLDLVTWTSLSANVTTNFAKGNLYAPVIARPGDNLMSTIDWSKRMVVRYYLSYFDQGSGITTEDKFALRIGDSYSTTLTGTLTNTGIGILVSGTSVRALTHNGSVESSVALGTLTDGQKYEIVLDHAGSSGVLKASMTGFYDALVGGGPTGDGASHFTSIVASSWNSPSIVSTARPHRRISDMEIAYY